MLPRHPWDKCGDVSTVPRSQIQLAEFNPRLIDADEKRRLKKSLEANGLSECLIWNKTTGRLLSGHQRLSILDKSAPEGDWLVPVIIRELDEIQEKQLLVAMNNRKAQGRDDDYKLGLILQTPGISIEACAFDLGQIKTILPQIAPAIPIVAAELAKNSAEWKQEKIDQRNREDAAVQRIMDGQRLNDKDEAKVLEEDDQFYLVAVWPDFAGKVKSLQALGINPLERFVKGEVVEELIKFAVEKGYKIQASSEIVP